MGFSENRNRNQRNLRFIVQINFRSSHVFDYNISLIKARVGKKTNNKVSAKTASSERKDSLGIGPKKFSH